jgi:hypothetical protein
MRPYIDDVVAVQSDSVTIDDNLDILDVGHFTVCATTFKLGVHFKHGSGCVGGCNVVLAYSLWVQVSVIECHYVWISGHHGQGFIYI